MVFLLLLLFCLVYGQMLSIHTQFTPHLYSNNLTSFYSPSSQEYTQKLYHHHQNMIIAMLSRIHDKNWCWKTMCGRHRINSVLYDTKHFALFMWCFSNRRIVYCELEPFHSESIYCSCTEYATDAVSVTGVIGVAHCTEKKYYIKPTQNENIVDSVPNNSIFCYAEMDDLKQQTKHSIVGF